MTVQQTVLAGSQRQEAIHIIATISMNKIYNLDRATEIAVGTVLCASVEEFSINNNNEAFMHFKPQ